MALVIIITIMVLWMGIVWSIYASINPFIDKLWDISNYNAAYYGAMMNIERWLLALKFHDAGFEWKSWVGEWNIADWEINHDFGRITTTPNRHRYWQITSRTTNSIPGSWDGNVESLFSAPDSNMYNSLSYYEWLELPLYLDNTTLATQYYTTVPANLWTIWTNRHIRWTFRLPPKITSGFNGALLDDSSDVDSDTINDDIIVNRSLFGVDTTAVWDPTFTIYPTISNNFGIFSPRYEYDNAIRESILNDWGQNINTLATSPNTNWFHFAIPGDAQISALSWHNVLPLWADIGNTWFNYIFSDTAISWLTLRFNISNRMRTSDGNLYPFLERRLLACTNAGVCNNNITLPDKFFTIDGSTTIGDYTVKIRIKKPVRSTSNTSNFTIIF